MDELTSVNLLRSGAGEFHNLGKFCGFSGNEGGVLRWRSQLRRGSQFGETLLHRGIGQTRVNFAIKVLDDLPGRPLGCE